MQPSDRSDRSLSIEGLEQDSGRRARTKAANRAAILEAGKRVFRTLGYDAATIRDVVRESGLSPGTFYNYFPDKQSVFAELVDELLHRLRPRLEDARAAATSMESFLFDAFHATVATLAEDAAMLDVIGKSAAAFRIQLHGGGEIGSLFGDLCRDLERASHRGILPPLPVEMVATAMLGTTVEVCLHLATRSSIGPAEVDEAARFLAGLFAGGLGRVAYT